VKDLNDINEKVAPLIVKLVSEEHQIGIRVCEYQNDVKIVDTWTGTMD
jgi:hypothetical protein